MKNLAHSFTFKTSSVMSGHMSPLTNEAFAVRLFN